VKRTVNGAAGMRPIERGRQRADAREQIVNRGRPEVSERGFEGNTAGDGLNPKRSGVIEPRVERRAFLVH
jgi:hypothetical protein